MKKRVTLSWFSSGNGNRGLGALTYSILFILKKIENEMNWKIEISILGDGVGKETVIINDNPIVINKIGFIKINSIKAWLKVLKHRHFKHLFIYIKGLFKTEYILDIGAGDSYTDIYGAKRFSVIDSSKTIFSLLGKKQLMLPQTIGPFANKKIYKKALKSLSKQDVIMTRDKQSYDFVKENLVGVKNLTELIDIAFFMPYTNKNFDNTKINVGLNISALLWHGGYTQNNQFGLTVDYKNMINAVIDFFIQIPDVHLYLVPHVVGADYDGVENDYAVSCAVAERYNHSSLSVAPFFFTPIEAKNFISGLDFFAGARMHACIAAFSSGVPVFPMAYSRKFNGLFLDTLQYKYMGDMRNQSETEILESIKSAYHNRNECKEIIQHTNDTIVMERYKIFMDELKEFLQR
jgi:polysaccharide pyruvyl transferase WcaK-like protein